MLQPYTIQCMIQRLARAGYPAQVDAAADKTTKERRVVDAIATMYAREQSTRLVAEALGVSGTSVVRWMKLSGYPVRGKGGCQYPTPPVTIDGETHSWQEWLPLAYWPQHERAIIKQRILRGWSLEKTLATPIRRRKVTRRKRGV